jgi:hypothetical protein
MPLTTMDGLVAALLGYPTTFGKNSVTAAAAGTPHTPWYAAGIVGAGAAPTGALNGASFTAPVNGAVPIPASVAGANIVLLGASVVQTGNVGAVWLVDRQWGNVPVVTTTTAQAVTFPTSVARDNSNSNAGVGVFLALECSAATTNGAPITNTTVSYTNSAGTAGRTATLASWPANAPQGTFIPLQLQAGDVGVQSVQSITLGTSYVTGQVNLIAYRYIARSFATPTANVPSDRGFTQLLAPRIWNGSVLQLVYLPSGTAVGTVYGELTYGQG